MAKLDDLIAQVGDDRLRGELTKAAYEVRKRKRFGLVFEEHIPEVTLLRNFPLRSGATVYRRQDEELLVPLRLESIRGKTATVAASPDGPVEKVPVNDLLTLKRFGESVYPALRPVEIVTRGGDKPYHAVIDGENYHTLQLLQFLYEGQVDCMYLDPPYNTGARDWKYNNNYVDQNDSWRHSKWLSFMEKRLRLAKRLLKPDGVVVIMIDEHERHHLSLLLEQLFPEYLRYMVSVVINSRGSTGNRNFGVVEEQALYLVPDLGYDLIHARERYVPDLIGRTKENHAEELLKRVVESIPDLPSRLTQAGEPLDDKDVALLEQLSEDDVPDSETVEDDGGTPGEYWRGAVRTGQDTSFREQRKKQFYPLYVDPTEREIVRVGEPLLEDESGNLLQPSWEPVEGLVPIWPVDEENQMRVWCFEPGRMRREIAAGNIKVGRFNRRRNTYAVNVRRVRRTEQRFREITVWWEPSYDAGSNGTNILKNLLGRSGSFPFPKSVYAVRDVLATVVGNRPNALIVDFFGGSGTTFHAACLLNAQDQGSRRTILVTNNEVGAEKASQLKVSGLFPGDEDYDKHGIFEAVTLPRIKAVIEGKRPDGRAIPGRHKWAARRPFAEGFPENCAFFHLDYLDPDDIELGQQFVAILPALWLAASGSGPLPTAKSTVGYLLPNESPFGVLLRESSIRQFTEALLGRPDVTHVWLVTDSERAFADMRATLPGHFKVSMLYRDYLRNFAINTGPR